MNKRLPAAALSALLLAAVPFVAVGCKSGDAEPEWTEPVEIVTLPELTVPAEPDTRAYTDLAPYTTERLDKLFVGSPTSAVADFTYTVTYDLVECGSVIITGYTGGDTVVVIPDTVEGMSVTHIAEGAFADKTFIEAISIPNTVGVIGKGAFKGCKGLESMRTPTFTCQDAPYFGALFGAETFEANGYSVPTSLKTLAITQWTAPEGMDASPAGLQIPATAFYACYSLEVVDLPAYTTEIGDFAFYGCQFLAYIDLGDTRLETVGRNAFTNCGSLLRLDIPDTAQSLGFAMLEGCGKLEALDLPFAGGWRVGQAPAEAEDGDATYLGYIFGAADHTLTEGFIPASLISVTLKKGCGDIAPNAFFACSPIREVNLPEGVTAIGRRAFYGCEGLAQMILPDTVATLGDDAFNGCIRLASFTGGKNLQAMGIQAFMNCLSLKTVTLPDTVTYLPNSCFAGCSALESLTADGVATQGKQVFRNCHKLGAPWIETAPATSEQ